MGKRGQPLRQHQSFSKARLLPRHRHPPQLPQVESTDNGKIADDDNAVISSIPSWCDPPLPDLSCLGNVGFEFLLCLYLHTALFCQYIYLYKTVWWYPISLPPSTTSLNFHHIDRNLTMFLSVFIIRRLWWSILWDFFRPGSKNAPGIMAWLLVCTAIGAVWIAAVCVPIGRLFSSTSLLNMVVLCYPILVWIPLTGFSGDSCLSAVISWMNAVDSPKVSGSDTIEAIFARQQLVHDIGLVRIASGYTVSKSKSNTGSTEKTPEIFSIHREMKVLCTDFNSRISEIVFCSMVCSYYVGLVPMFFMKSHQYYDMVWSLLHTLLVLLNSFGLLSTHLFKPQYIHFVHKCVLWHEELKFQMKQAASKTKGEHICGTQGEGDTNDDELKHEVLIDDASTSRFCYIFQNLLRLIDWLLVCHAFIVAFQLYLLLSSSEWDHLISLALMQFFSYYVLFRSTRDRIVLSKSRSLHALVSQHSHNLPGYPA